MRTPRVEFDLGKIRANSKILCERLRSVGIDVKGVTKGVGGDSQIAAAMLDGGVTGLADARLSNVLKLRTNGINCPIALIRSPMHDQLAELVVSCNMSYHSDLTTLDLLGQAARDANRCHSVMLMVEAGDGRDGLPIERLEHFVAAVLNTPGLTLNGVGANFSCMQAVPPTSAALMVLSNAIERVESCLSTKIACISGGNSTSLPLALAHVNLGRVNELRLGEAILLGIEPLSGRVLPGLFDDAFVLFAEVIESSRKTRDAPLSNEKLNTENSLTNLNQAVLAIGTQDTDIRGLKPPTTMSVLGASSDHLVLNTGGTQLAIGSEVPFRMNYSAMSRLMNNPEVIKHAVN